MEQQKPQLISSAYKFDDEYPQLLCSVYRMENGIVYKWTRKSLYEDYQIHVIHDAGKEGCGCGNPWNIIWDYKEEILVTKPKSKKIFEQDSGMYHKILSSQELPESMLDFLSGDMWCVYTITEDRNKIIKTYFDFRADPWEKNSEGVATRERLMKDPSELIVDINNGYTVVFVYGSREFIELYFVKISDEKIMSIEVTHSLDKK